MLSLRRTAMIGGALSAMASILVGAFVLLSSIENNVLERFDRALADRHTQLVVALSYAANDPEQLQELLFDPSYGTPFSGRYWQVTGPDDQIFTSASMLETSMTEPAGRPNSLTRRSIRGPEGEPIRSLFQSVTLQDGSAWGVSVGESLAALAAERQQTRRSLLLAFVLVALLGLAGAIVQTTTILRPLEKLRRDVSHRWERNEDLTVEDYPEEVAPLVADINHLLVRNRDIIARARRQAADLAHALKTPTAILRNELSTQAAHGHDMKASLDALDRVDAQLGRSLARMRAANSGASASQRTDLTNSVDRFTRLFSSMAHREGKRMTTTCGPGLAVRMDQQDIEEVMGNVLDNAVKWCKSRIALRVHERGEGIEITIEDDGPGIPEGSEREALRSGGRLDSSKPGTGLGLAIAIDLLEAYGAKLHLDKSDRLGGLAVRIIIPGGTQTAVRRGVAKAA